MYFHMWALYAGPDQVMAVTSALASLFGVLLIFWNKLVGTFVRLTRIFRKDAGLSTSMESTADQPKNTTSTGIN